MNETVEGLLLERDTLRQDRDELREELTHALTAIDIIRAMWFSQSTGQYVLDAKAVACVPNGMSLLQHIRGGK